MNLSGLRKKIIEVEALYVSPRPPPQEDFAEKRQLPLQILPEAIQSFTPTL